MSQSQNSDLVIVPVLLFDTLQTIQESIAQKGSVTHHKGVKRQQSRAWAKSLKMLYI